MNKDFADLIPAERRHQIIQLLQEKDVVTIAELTEIFKVSHMTIRRDLQKLEETGILTQITGGAQLSKSIVTEPTHYQKETMFAPEKDAIGRCAAALIPPNAIIYLDAGTTSLAVCRHIAARTDLTIVSNDFAVMNYLMDHCRSKLIHTGGHINADNRSAIGYLAANTIAGLSFDIGFLSASSWGPAGITTPEENKVPVKAAVVRSSRQRVLISDHSKYGQTAAYLAVPLTALTAVICDNQLPEHARRAINKLDINLILVDAQSEVSADTVGSGQSSQA